MLLKPRQERKWLSNHVRQLADATFKIKIIYA